MFLAGIMGLATMSMVWGYYMQGKNATPKPVPEPGSEPEPDSKPDAESTYVGKYVQRFEALDSTANEDDLTNLEVVDDTPDGRVTMQWNGTPGSFQYWADSKTIKFEHLDSMARLFCTTHNCKAQFADGTTGANVKQKDTETAGSSSIFAAFKHYNAKGSTNRSSAHTSIKNQFKHVGSLKDRKDKDEEPGASREEKVEYKTWAEASAAQENK